MSKTEETLSGEQIKEWAEKDFVIAEVVNDSRQNRRNPQDIISNGISFNAQETGNYLYLSGHFPIKITRVPNQNVRKIGYIDGVNSDGSFHIYMLGNDDFNLTPSHNVLTDVNLQLNFHTLLLPPSDDRWTPKELLTYRWVESSGAAIDYRQAYAYKNNNLTNFVTTAECFEYQPHWGSYNSALSSYLDCAKINDDYLYDTQGEGTMQVSLTNNLNTLQLGVPMNVRYYQRSMSGMYYGDKNIGGDLYDLMNVFSQSFNNGVRNNMMRNIYHQETINGNPYNIINIYPYFQGSFAYHYTPYNLILTYNLDEAKRYVDTGELPSDAFLYPFDVDNISINETGGTGAEDSDGTQADDSISTGGESGGEETDDQTTEAPTNTPQALTNNNLYWLTSQQLKNFIEWFWTDATDVTNPQELFEKIQGLYSDLSQAIVSIRYMPIDADWVGGVSTASSIIVGLVEKTETVRTINKTVAPVRDIATDISISELPDFKGFINFSPYCEISLYLPFYGYLSLDADLLMQNKLTIKATYDILSGTIQYYIFRVSSKTNDATMINTVTGKMAVDIPISLQTKNERDSMIFNNVASATANLIGAGASAVAGNPIGMVMSTSAIAGQQSQGAPMRVMGTIGESGAFYDHGHCAIFIKRPATNYPPQYARRVGYPYNGARKLEKTHGFIQCFNPYVEFTHMTVNDSDIQPPKPTAEEIETIYNALTEGVILP